MRLLVTGSSGFVGNHLVPALQERGHEVVGVDREEPDPRYAPDSFIQGDLLDRKTLQKGFDRNVDAVFHLAAAKGDWGISEEEYVCDNVEATRALIEASQRRGVREHVFYSTVAVLGPSEEPIGEEAPFNPAIPYGSTKVTCEKLYRRWADEESGARVSVIRPSAIFGRLQPWSTNVHRLIEAIYKRRFVMIGDGSALKTTSYIDNLMAATFFLWDRLEEGVHTYMYIDEPVMSTRQLVRWIYQNLERKPPSWHLPLALVKPLAKVSDAAAAVTGIDLPITAARIEKFCTSTNFDASAIRALGFEQPVSNREAVADTVAWQLEQYDK